MISTKARGRAVRHRILDFRGRISYYDPTSGLVWVVWLPKPINPDLSTYTAGGYRASELVKIPGGALPEMRFGTGLTSADPVRNMTTVMQSQGLHESRGAKHMARNSKVAEVEEFDEFDDLDEVDEDEEVEAKPAKGKSKAAAKKETPKGITARQLAEKLDTDPKNFRAWLRRTVAAGKESWAKDLAGRAEKERYNFGEKWSDPLVTGIMQSFKEADHTPRGRGKKAAEGEAKAPAKKAPAKKAPAKKS